MEEGCAFVYGRPRQSSSVLRFLFHSLTSLPFFDLLLKFTPLTPHAVGVPAMITNQLIDPFPFRTRKLSSSAPMVLHGQLCGRVRRCRFYKEKAPYRVLYGAFLRHYLLHKELLEGLRGEVKRIGSHSFISHRIEHRFMLYKERPVQVTVRAFLHLYPSLGGKRTQHLCYAS